MEDEILELYEPHEKQLEAHNAREHYRYRVLVWGRQAGKSTWAINELARASWENEDHIYWLISPTYSQAEILFRRSITLLTHPSNQHALYDYSKSKLWYQLESGSFVYFKSGDNPDSLRTETLNGKIIDECRDQHPDLWPMIIQPMLRTTGGWGAFIGSANGFDWMYDLSQRSLTDPNWFFMNAPSTCNPLFTMAEALDAKKNMSDLQYRQEIMAEFVDIHSEKPYWNYNEAINDLHACPFDTSGRTVMPYLPIILGCDFNLSPMIWQLGQQRAQDFYWFDEIFKERTNTQEMTRAFIEKVKGHEPGVVVVGDATGKAGQRITGQSDYDILFQGLNQANIKWVNKTPDSNPLVKDRINHVNARLKDAEGNPHLWLHPVNNKYLKRDLQRVTWKPNVGRAELDKTKDPLLTHASDGMGYPICALSPIPGVYAKPIMVVRMI